MLQYDKIDLSSLVSYPQLFDHQFIHQKKINYFQIDREIIVINSNNDTRFQNRLTL